MSVYVVDASVAAKWFFDEPNAREAAAILEGHNELHAPDLLLLEMDSLICKRVRRKEITADEGNEIHEAFRQFPVIGHGIAGLADPAYELAVATGQTVYDCLYVSLAMLIGGPMVTADRRLYEALRSGPFTEHLLWVGDIGKEAP